ncbi:hypothetical protein [Janthinobacterium sp. RT4P48]|uniref:hypothetical protein n=1 Tax=Janthinobacterium sp. RT4P48 TaxID=3424188 RepID=UPI003F202881
MRCTTCGEYGDLIRAVIRKTGQEVIVCTECDALWTQPQAGIDTACLRDVAAHLLDCGLPPDWAQLELGARVPTTGTA